MTDAIYLSSVFTLFIFKSAYESPVSGSGLRRPQLLLRDTTTLARCSSYGRRQMYETTLLSDQQKVDCKKKGRAQHHISSSTEFCVFLGTGGESSVHPRSLLMLAGDIEKTLVLIENQ